MDTLERLNQQQPRRRKSVSEQELVALVYDAVGDSKGWIRVLRTLDGAFQGRTLTIVFRDPRKVLFACTREHANGLTSTNPSSVFGDRSLSRRGFLGAHVLRRDGTPVGELVEQWHDARERVQLAETRSLVEIFRSAEENPPWPDEDRGLLRRLLPHLHRALALSLKLGRERARNDGLARVVGALQLGIVLVGAENDVRYLNQAAERLLKRTPSLSLRGDRLHATPESQDAELARRLRAAALATSKRTPASCLTFGEGSSSVLVWIARLRPGLALAMLTAPNRRTIGSHGALRHALGLSPREAQVAGLFARGCTCEDIGARLLMRPATARLHLKHVLAKTDTHRQVELLRRIVDCLPEIALLG